MFFSEEHVADVIDDFQKLYPGVLAHKQHGFVFVNDQTKDNWVQIDCSLKDVQVWEKVGAKTIKNKENPPNGLYHDKSGETRNFIDLDDDQM